MSKKMTTHHEQIAFLNKIEGQVCGVRKMVDEGRYCVDIINQINAVIGGLHRVGDEIFKKHLEGCVIGALRGKSESEKLKKINEVVDIIYKFRKSS